MHAAVRLSLAACLVALVSPPLRAEDPADPWNAPFIEAVGGCDELIVGGVVGPDEGTVVTTVRGAAGVASVLDMIDFDPETSGPSCCCVGTLLFTFRRAGKTVATLTFHHGRSFRWDEDGGPWIGDGHLTRASSWALSRWLAGRGAPGPLRELEQHVAGEATKARLRKRYEALLPPASLEAVARAKQAADAARAWGEAYDEALRAALAIGTESEAELLRRLLTLFGCHEGTWSRYVGLEWHLQELLHQVHPAVYAEFLQDLPEDEDLRNGLARILFNMPMGCPAPRAQTSAVLAQLAPRALTHPRAANRRQAMAGLVHWDREASLPWLRKVLAGLLTPRPFPEGVPEREGALGDARFRNEYPPELDDVSDAVAAAWLLSRLGDVESLPAIQALAADATGMDARVLASALARLTDEE